MNLLETQNHQGLDTHLWKVLNCSDEGTGNLFTIAIDEKTKEWCKEADNSIHHGFGNILSMALAKRVLKKKRRRN